MVLTTLLCLSAVCASAQVKDRPSENSQLSPDTVAIAGSVRVSLWDHRRIVVVEVPDTLTFLYLPHNEIPLDSLARRENLRCLINGSFFQGVRGNAQHAGWLAMYGQKLTPTMDDRQLTHVVVSNGSAWSTTFVPARTFAGPTGPAKLEFQTGPLIIENGRIREDLIRGSINGSTAHARTLLATIDQRRCFFISVTSRMTLSDLAAGLVRFSIFSGGRLDVIDLDGGSSVALYVRDVPLVNTNVHDRLPIVIGFH